MGKLAGGVSYCFSGLVIRTYNKKKYLSMPKHAMYEVVDDLSDVKNDDHPQECDKELHCSVIANSQMEYLISYVCLD